MRSLATVGGVLVLMAVLLDAFESVVLPRRVRRQFRISGWFYRRFWRPWVKLAYLISSQTRRETLLGYFAPLSLIALLAVWAMGLIFGFALLQHGGGGHVLLGNRPAGFSLLLYHSGETFFTLGYGDITPASGLSRALSVAEAGMGFAFLGVVIGYLPTIYSAFSRREIEISLLDARAGSPPTAAELLGRAVEGRDEESLDDLFHDWERWAAEVLESHISYPVLSYYRSQHSNQSWLGALTVILDATTLVIAGIEGMSSAQARRTFKMARHAVVDLAQVINAPYDPQAHERVTAEDLNEIRSRLAEKGLRLDPGPAAQEKLAWLRQLYEPYVVAMAEKLYISLPPWISRDQGKDNWQRGPWDRLFQARALGQHSDRAHALREEHF